LPLLGKWEKDVLNIEVSYLSGEQIVLEQSITPVSMGNRKKAELK
jgi:hypothetical protein